ncbi:hypothetical protein CB1_000568025 [Camelus ferus]|nr:hypothetical protein CB1_000568025 [Camelus ferus]
MDGPNPRAKRHFKSTSLDITYSSSSRAGSAHTERGEELLVTAAGSQGFLHTKSLVCPSLEKKVTQNDWVEKAQDFPSQNNSNWYPHEPEEAAPSQLPLPFAPILHRSLCVCSYLSRSVRDRQEQRSLEVPGCRTGRGSHTARAQGCFPSLAQGPSIPKDLLHIFLVCEVAKDQDMFGQN